MRRLDVVALFESSTGSGHVRSENATTMSSRPEPDKAPNPPEVQSHLTPVEAVGATKRTRRQSRRRVDRAGVATRPIGLVTTAGEDRPEAESRTGDAEPAPEAISTSGEATFWSDDGVQVPPGSPSPDRRRAVRHRASPLDYLPKLSLMPFVVALNFVVFIWLIWTVIS